MRNKKSISFNKKYLFQKKKKFYIEEKILYFYHSTHKAQITIMYKNNTLTIGIKYYNYSFIIIITALINESQEYVLQRFVILHISIYLYFCVSPKGYKLYFICY